MAITELRFLLRKRSTSAMIRKELLTCPIYSAVLCYMAVFHRACMCCPVQSRLTSNEPFFRWIPVSVTQTVVQINQHPVDARFQKKKQSLVCTIAAIKHCGSQGCRASQINSPRIAADIFYPTISSPGLNKKYAVFSGRAYVPLRDCAVRCTCLIFLPPTWLCAAPFLLTDTKMDESLPVQQRAAMAQPILLEISDQRSSQVTGRVEPFGSRGYKRYPQGGGE